MTLKFFARDAAGNLESVKTETYSFEIRVPGDLDGSGAVDIADSILALKIVSGISLPPGVTIHTENSVNASGKVGMDDMLHIIKKVAGVR
jgi:hypothetical protein